MNPRPNNIRRKDKGFTLLELVIAMGILAAVVSMVFGIARTSLQLGNTIVETQAEEMKHQAFFELLHNRFSSLPGNARLDIQVESSSPPYISQVTIEDVPLSFTWGGQELIAEAVKLSTVKRRSGYLDIVLSYYEEKILDSTDEDADSGSLVDQEPFAEIILLRDVAYFEWRALDSTTLEWQYDWEISTRLPIQLELVMAIGAQGEEIREIFWLPPKENPETVIEQMLQTGNSGSSTGSSSSGSSSSDRQTSPSISIPTTGDGK